MSSPIPPRNITGGSSHPSARSSALNEWQAQNMSSPGGARTPGAPSSSTAVESCWSGPRRHRPRSGCRRRVIGTAMRTRCWPSICGTISTTRLDLASSPLYWLCRSKIYVVKPERCDCWSAHTSSSEGQRAEFSCRLSRTIISVRRVPRTPPPPGRSWHGPPGLLPSDCPEKPAARCCSMTVDRSVPPREGGAMGNVRTCSRVRRQAATKHRPRLRLVGACETYGSVESGLRATWRRSPASRCPRYQPTNEALALCRCTSSQPSARRSTCSSSSSSTACRLTAAGPHPDRTTT